MAEEKSHTFKYTSFPSKEGLDTLSLELLLHAEKAMAKAYAPYSRFKVGAAIRLEGGEVFTGNNQENVAYPSGLCAERVALFHAMSQNPGAVIEAVAISADAEDFNLSRVITPCGACRQALLEYEVNSASPIVLIMGSSAGEVIQVPSVLSTLPLSFSETKLRKS